MPSSLDKRRLPSRILFFSSEPGGAEVLIPVIQLLKRVTNYEIVVLGYGHGLDRFNVKKIACMEVRRVAERGVALLEEIEPNLLITSATSLPEYDMSDRRLWQGARSLGIPSMAFLDQWQNYAVRFSGAAGKDRLAYQPDFINCINEIGEREMLNEGFDRSRLVKFGHPYLSSLRTLRNNITREEIASRIGIDINEKVAVFVSEPIREHFGRSRGYDQHDALKMFFGILSTSTETLRPVVKLHPKDDLNEYCQYLRNCEGNSPLFVRNELTSIDCISLADYVFGMSSIMLIESWCLGKPIASLQPNLQVQDPFLLSRLGIISALTGMAEMDFHRVFSGSLAPPKSFSIAFQEDSFLEFLRDLLGLS